MLISKICKEIMKLDLKTNNPIKFEYKSKQKFSVEDSDRSETHKETFLNIKEMENKPTLRFHLIQIRMVKIKKYKWQLIQARMLSKRGTPPLMVEVQPFTTILKSNMGIPSKDRSSTTSISCYTNLEHILKEGLIIQLEHFFNHVLRCSTHNIQRTKAV